MVTDFENSTEHVLETGIGGVWDVSFTVAVVDCTSSVGAKM